MKSLLLLAASLFFLAANASAQSKVPEDFGLCMEYAGVWKLKSVDGGEESLIEDKKFLLRDEYDQKTKVCRLYFETYDVESSSQIELAMDGKTNKVDFTEIADSPVVLELTSSWTEDLSLTEESFDSEGKQILLVATSHEGSKQTTSKVLFSKLMTENKMVVEQIEEITEPGKPTTKRWVRFTVVPSEL